MTEAATALAAMHAALATLAGQDAASLADEDVRAQLAELLVVANRVHATVVKTVGLFDERSLAKPDGLRTTRAWLSGFGRLSPYAATDLVRKAQLLRELPAVSEAAERGDVPPEHLTKLTRLAENVGLGAVTQIDGVLAELASVATPAQLADACDRIVAHVDPDGPTPDPAYERRGLTFARIGDMVHVRGRLDQEAGAIVMAALDAVMRPPTPTDTRTAAQRRADAFVELARMPLNTGVLPTVAGERPHIGLLITPAALTNGTFGAVSEPDDDAAPAGDEPIDLVDQYADDPLAQAGIPPLPDPPWLAWAGKVSPESARRIACDSLIYRIVADPATGQPLDVGRSHRSAPAWLRRALHARDQGCRWPGCDAPVPYTDAHHLTPWSGGGSTAVEDMLLLCRWHHMTVHEGRWRIRLDPRTGHVGVTRPDGRPYELGPSVPWPHSGGPPA